VGAVLFDAVGTLFSPRGSIGEIYSHVAAAHGLSIPAARLEDRFRRFGRDGANPVDREEWRESVAGIFEGLGEFDDFAAFFDELYETFCSGRRWRLFPEVIPALTALGRAGVPMGVVTNFDERIHGILGELAIDAFFLRVETPHSAGFRKPDPRIFLQAGRALGVAPSRTLVVGDDPLQDLEAARRAGMRAFLVDRRENRSAASFVIPDLSPVPTLAAPAPPGESPP
jgi:putative hydrolase of the HAD superfamily